MFARQRDPGLWTFDSVITGAELEYWDASVANAIDGSGGGAYSLNSVMTIGGAPGIYWQFDLGVVCTDYLGVQGVFEVFNAVGMYGNVTIGSGPGDLLVAQCPARFDDTLTALGLVELADTTITGEFTATDNAFFNDPVNFGSDVVFHDGTVTIGATGTDVLVVAATAQFNGSTTFGGGATFALPIGFSGAGKIKYRTKTIAVTGNQSVVAAHYDVVYVPSGLMSGSDVITIDDSFAEDGMSITFLTNDTTNGTAIQTPAGLTQAIKSAAGFPLSLTAHRIDGTWRFAFGKL